MSARLAEPRSVDLGEWDEVERHDLELTPRDRSLAASLRSGDGRLVIDELRTGLRIKATSWVGVVRFERFEVQIRPKYARDNLGLLQMLAYTRGIDALREVGAVRQLAVEGAHLLDLIALLLAREASELMRDGLLQDYVEREDTLGMVRGRLLPFEQVTRHHGRVDALECRFEEFETDIDENRLVSAALDAVGRVAQHGLVRQQVNRARGVFGAACDASQLDGSWIREEPEYTRRNQHYERAHLFARLILRERGVQDLYAPGRATSFAFLLDMNRLFEEFVTRLLQRRVAGAPTMVLAQKRERSLLVRLPSGQSYGTVIPDILVEWRDGAETRRLPVDAKYKLLSEGRIDPGDLYQLFFYAYAYGPDDATGQDRRAIILYPSRGERRTDVGVNTMERVQSARISAIGVDLVRILEGMERGVDVAIAAVDEIVAVISNQAKAA